MEWISDWYDENYYKHSPEKNPQGPKHGTKKVLRGGVANNNPEFNPNFGRVEEDIDYTHDKEILKMFNFTEGDALFNHGSPLRHPSLKTHRYRQLKNRPFKTSPRQPGRMAGDQE